MNMKRVFIILFNCLFACSISGISTKTLASPYCVALQGNGDGIFGHFHSLARMLEEFGPMEAIAGSSSATITMFLYESMLINPVVSERNLSEEEQALRLSLLLKSLVGFYQHHLPYKEKIVFQISALEELLDPNIFDEILQTPDSAFQNNRIQTLNILHFIENVMLTLGTLYNPRFGELFWQSPNPLYHIKDFYDSLSGGKWNINGPKIFLRPFPVDFNGIATIVGQFGNFYASRGYDVKIWEDWIKKCGPLDQFKNKSWGEIVYAEYSLDNHQNFFDQDDTPHLLTQCGQGFYELLSNYDAHSWKDDTNILSRIDEPVGKYLRTIPITGILVGNGALKMERAIDDFWNAYFDINLNIDYANEAKVGLFGRDSDLEAISRTQAYNLMNGTLTNLKAQNFMPLPHYTWRMAMTTSPAEPTLAEAKVIVPHKIVSIGGWVDPQPATALKYAGCTNIVSFIGETEDTSFLNSLNDIIGGNAFNERLTSHQYLEDYGASAFIEGLLDSDAVWCTDWHNYRGTDIKSVYEMSEITYRSPFEVRSSFFQTHHYPWESVLNRPSCTPGV